MERTLVLVKPDGMQRGLAGEIIHRLERRGLRIVDRAEVPKSPLAATGRRTWMLSALIGLVLAVAVAFGLDYMNDTIKTPEDVTRRLKLPFLGLVPSVRGDKHPLLASSHVPHDFGESFRALRRAGWFCPWCCVPSRRRRCPRSRRRRWGRP